MKKKLFLLEQLENNGWETYDSCVVCAENKEAAKKIHPANVHYEVGIWWSKNDRRYDWATSIENVKCTLIGDAFEHIELNSVICASFNAG